MAKTKKTSNGLVTKIQKIPNKDVFLTKTQLSKLSKRSWNKEIKRVLKDDGNFVLLDMTRPLNMFTKRLHKLGTFITLHLIGIVTFSFKQYRFLYTSLDKLEAPESFLKESGFNSYTLVRMGIFGFVYLSVLKKS